MKQTLKFTIIFLLLISFAFSFTPQGDIELFDYYAIYNATNITGNKIFQNGSQVLDTDDLNSSVFNYSSYSNNSDYLEDRNTNEVGSYLEGVYGWITNSVSDLVNYYTKTETYNKTEVDTTFNDYSTTAEVIAFGYYNSSDFVITDYFTKTDIQNFGYYNSSDFNITDYFTSAEVLAFNYYNISDFDITDYVTSSTLSGYNYYNSSDFNINDYILSSNESSLDVNSANYWDNLNTPSDINAGDITDDGTYIKSTDESSLDVNSADFWDGLGSPSDFSTLTATGLITANEFSGALNWSYLQNYPASCPADTYLTQLGDSVTCTGIADVYASNSGDNLSNEYQFSGLVSLENETIISDMTSVDSKGSVLYQSLDSNWLDLETNTALDSNLYSTNDGTMIGFDRNDGTVNGGVSIEDDGMSFDGSTGYIKSQDSFNYNVGGADENPITIHLRINIEDINNEVTLLDTGDGSLTSRLRLNIYDNNKLKLIVRPGGLGSSTIESSSLSNGVYDVFIFDSGDRIYLSYIPVGENEVIVGNYAAGGDRIMFKLRALDIGRNYGGAKYFNDSINFIRIWKSYLSDNERLLEINSDYAFKSENLVVQYSGKDYTGTESSPTTIYDTNMITAGHSDEVSALSFDGVDDYVEVGSNSQFNFSENSSFSLSVWIYSIEDNQDSIIISKMKPEDIYNGYDLTIDNNRIESYIISDYLDDNYISIKGGDFIFNSWQHLVLTYDGSSKADGVHLYVNTEETNKDVEKDNLKGNINSDLILTLGSRSLGGSNFNGSISNLLIKDYAMTQSEITALYNRDKIYFEDSNPSGHLGDFGIRGDLNLPNLIGTGNDYACIDENGKLYRSAGACS